MNQKIIRSPYPYALIALMLLAWIALPSSAALMIPALAIGGAFCGAGMQKRADRP